MRRYSVQNPCSVFSSPLIVYRFGVATNDCTKSSSSHDSDKLLRPRRTSMVLRQHVRGRCRSGYKAGRLAMDRSDRRAGVSSLGNDGKAIPRGPLPTSRLTWAHPRSCAQRAAARLCATLTGVRRRSEIQVGRHPCGGRGARIDAVENLGVLELGELAQPCSMEEQSLKMALIVANTTVP